MSIAALQQSWRRFRDAARALGLNRLWVLPREACERRMPAGAGAGTLAALHPDCRRAVLLGSGGRAFWEGFRRAAEGEDPAESDPLDRYSERVIEALRAIAGLAGVHLMGLGDDGIASVVEGAGLLPRPVAAD